MNDNDILKRIKEGSEQELMMVYQKYRSDLIYWIIRKYGMETEDARDIYQVSVLTLYENIIENKVTELKSTLKTYLYAIAKNKTLEKINEQKRFNRFNEAIKHETIHAEEDAEYTEDHDKIQKVHLSLEQLGDPCRSILEMFYYNKASVEKITENLGYKNADTTKNLKYKCLQRLRKIFLND